MDLSEQARGRRTYRTRRWFFRECGVGLGSVALGSLLGGGDRRAAAADRTADPLAPKAPHFAGEGQAGDLPVPGRGAEPPRPVRRQAANCASSTAPCRRRSCSRATARRSSTRARPCSAPKFKFSKHGQCGAELSELLPHLGEVVDDVAIVKSMVTDAFNHAPAQIFMNTGSPAVRPAEPRVVGHLRPGLRERRTCPPTSSSAPARRGPAAGRRNWGCGFLPTVHQGVPFRGQGDPVLYLSNPAGHRRRDPARLARRRRAP